MAPQPPTQARAWFAQPSWYLGFIAAVIIGGGVYYALLMPMARVGVDAGALLPALLILGTGGILGMAVVRAARQTPDPGLPYAAAGAIAGLVLAMFGVACTPAFHAASTIQEARANVRIAGAFLGRAPAIQARVDGDSASLAAFSLDAAFMQSVAEASTNNQQVMQSLLAARALGVAMPFVTDNGMLRAQDTARLRKVALAVPGNPVAAAWLGRRAETLAVAH